MTDLKPGGINEGFEGRALGAVHETDVRNDLFTMDRFLEYPGWAGTDHGASFAPAERPKSKIYSVGRIRDQGAVPMCVGMANRALLDAAPVKNTPDGKYIPQYIWKESQKVDEFPGELDSQGTSQLAAAKVLSREGFYTSYAWARKAQGYEDIVNWLAERGPVVLIVPWYSGMNTPDSGGFIHPGGNLVGSHAQLVYGYSEWGTLYVQGSWGVNWGNRGTVYLAPDDFNRLFAHTWATACSPVEVVKGKPAPKPPKEDEKKPEAPPKPPVKPSKPSGVYLPDPTDNLKVSPNRYKGGGGNAMWGVTIHYEVGYHDASVAWLMNPLSQASAHWCIRRDGFIQQIVPETDRAWHGREAGMQAYGIEHEGDKPGSDVGCFWTTPKDADKLRDDDRMLVASANLTAYLIHKYPNLRANYQKAKHDFSLRNGVPRRDTASTICGHDQLAGNDHTDPSTLFPWRGYIACVDDFLAGRWKGRKGPYA